jgi:hypothetical protein
MRPVYQADGTTMCFHRLEICQDISSETRKTVKIGRNSKHTSTAGLIETYDQ